jgi:hypothetical protein
VRAGLVFLIAAATAGAQYPDSAKYTRIDTMVTMGAQHLRREGLRLPRRDRQNPSFRKQSVVRRLADCHVTRALGLFFGRG